MFHKGNMVVIATKNLDDKVYEYKIGEVRIVDVISDSENKTQQVSYDIFVEEEKCIYKHIPHCQVNTLPAFLFFLRIMKLPEKHRVNVMREVVSSLEIYFDVNERDLYGNTILHVIKILKCPDLVNFAIEMGAFKYFNDNGESQYDLAKRLDCGESVDLLKELSGPHPLGIKCEKCGKFIDDKSNYCPRCKERPNFNRNKRIYPDYDMDETILFCYRCGAPVRFVHSFCATCGEKIK